MINFTKCCGKPVERHSEDIKAGYSVKCGIPAVGDYYCQRCKRDITPNGNIKKTPRNEDIDKNGSWDYVLDSDI